MPFFVFSVVDSNFAAIPIEYGTTLDVLLTTKKLWLNHEKTPGTNFVGQAETKATSISMIGTRSRLSPDGTAQETKVVQKHFAITIVLGLITANMT